MDHIGILKRAFNITRRYRALWIFGTLLAFFAGTGGGRGGRDFSIPGGRSVEFPGRMPQGFVLPEISDGAIAGIVVTFCFVLLLLTIAGVIVSYVARTALYRMVNEIEDAGSSPSWREGFRLGWSKRALRLFGIDLVIGIPLAVGAILVLLLAASPLLMLSVQSDALNGLAVVMTIGMGLLAIALIIIVSVLANLAKRFMHRHAALDDHSVGQSIVRGYHMLRGNVKDSAVMWLLMLGVGFAWGIVMIPVFVIVLLLAMALGVLPAYLIWRGTEILWLTLLVGIPLFLLVLIPPMVFLGGLFEVFRSSVWTLSYRKFQESGWRAELPARDGDIQEPTVTALEGAAPHTDTAEDGEIDSSSLDS